MTGPPAIDEGLAETLTLAASAVGAVGADPLVGAIVARPGPDGPVVGRGWHRREGAAHAEPQAIAAAGAAARGSTLICNLEPCGYTAPGKRQPACTGAIIAAGIARVVVGRIDPHPQVSGRGIAVLRAAGIGVELADDPLPFWLADPLAVTTTTFARPLVAAIGPGTAGIATLAVPPMELPAGATVDVAELGRLPAGARVVRLRLPTAAIDLPVGWTIDLADGRPTIAWIEGLTRHAAAVRDRLVREAALVEALAA